MPNKECFVICPIGDRDSSTRKRSDQVLKHIIKPGQKIPFDIAPMRTVEFNLADPDELVDAVERLKRQIDAAEKNPAEADNPISSAIDVQSLKSSSDPNAKASAQILEQKKHSPLSWPK